MEDLPYDIKHYEILSRLDNPSKKVLLHVLIGDTIALAKDDQSLVIRHGLEFTKFWYSLGF